MKLPPELYSPDTLSFAIMELSHYSGALRDYAARATAGHAPQPQPPEVLAHILDILDVPNDLEAIENLRKNLEQHLLKAPTVHLILAAFPSSAVKRQLAQWFRAEISNDILLTFAVRSDIGGGIVVQAGSHLYDFSFKRTLLSNKARISEIANV